MNAARFSSGVVLRFLLILVLPLSMTSTANKGRGDRFAVGPTIAGPAVMEQGAATTASAAAAGGAVVGTVIGVVATAIAAVAGIVFAPAGSPGEPEISNIDVALDPDPGSAGFHVGDHTGVKVKFGVHFGRCTDSGTLEVKITTEGGTISLKDPSSYPGTRNDFELQGGQIVGFREGSTTIKVEVIVKGEQCDWVFDNAIVKEKSTEKTILVNKPYEFDRTVSPLAITHGQRTNAKVKTKIRTIVEGGRAQFVNDVTSDGKNLILPPAPGLTAEHERELLVHLEGHRERHPCTPEIGFDTVTLDVKPFNIAYRIPAKKFKPVSPKGDYVDAQDKPTERVSDTVTCPHASPPPEPAPPVPPVEQHLAELPLDPPGDEEQPVAITGRGRFVDELGQPAVEGVKLSIADQYGNAIGDVQPTANGEFSFTRTLGFFLELAYGGGPWYEEYTSAASRPEFVAGTDLVVVRTPTPVLNGKVVNQAGAPLLAEFTLRDPKGNRFLGTTRGDGTFVLGSIPKLEALTDPGRMVLNVRVLTQRPGQVFTSTEITLPLNIGDAAQLTLAPIVFQEKLTPDRATLTLSGTVRQFDYLSQAFVPVRGFMLQTSNPSTGAVTATATTDQAGAFALALPGGVSFVVHTPNALEYGLPPFRANTGTSLRLVEDLALGVVDLARTMPAADLPRGGHSAVSGQNNPAAEKIVVKVNPAVAGFTTMNLADGTFTVPVPALRVGDRVLVFETFKGVAGPPQRTVVAGATTDADGDGILDTVDACAVDREDPDGTDDNDGCPEPDGDGDGNYGTLDACPAVAEDPDGIADADGCPETNGVFLPIVRK